MGKRFKPLLNSRGEKVQHLFVYIPTGMIYVRKTFKGLGIPPIDMPTGETTLGKAKTRAEVLINQWKNKHTGVDDSKVFGRRRGKLFREVAERVLKVYTPTVREKTQLKHRLIIPLLMEKWGSYEINSIDIEDFYQWINEVRISEQTKVLKKGERRRRTFNDYVKYMSLVMSQAYKWKLATHRLEFRMVDKTRRLELAEKKGRGKLSKTDREEIKQLKDSRAFTADELSGLYGTLRGDIRDQFVFAFECYMRLREVLHLSWDEINLETGVITLPPWRVKTGSKTGQGRSFRVSANTLEILLRRYENSGTQSKYVFPSRSDPKKSVDSNRSAWTKALKELRIDGRWHWIRHTALTWALLGDPRIQDPKERAATRKNPIDVSLYAGVSMKTIMSVYIHPEDHDTSEAALKLPKGCGRGVEE